MHHHHHHHNDHLSHDQTLPHTWSTSSLHKPCNQDPLSVSSVAAGDDDDGDGNDESDDDGDGDDDGDDDDDDGNDDHQQCQQQYDNQHQQNHHSSLTASPSPRCPSPFSTCCIDIVVTGNLIIKFRGSPTPEIQWQKNGFPLPKSDRCQHYQCLVTGNCLGWKCFDQTRHICLESLLGNKCNCLISICKIDNRTNGSALKMSF